MAKKEKLIAQLHFEAKCKHKLYMLLLFVLGGRKQIVIIGDSSPNINCNVQGYD